MLLNGFREDCEPAELSAEWRGLLRVKVSLAAVTERISPC